jgi:hypothetical protein
LQRDYYLAPGLVQRSIPAFAKASDLVDAGRSLERLDVTDGRPALSIMPQHADAAIAIRSIVSIEHLDRSGAEGRVGSSVQCRLAVSEIFRHGGFRARCGDGRAGLC